MAQKYYAIKKGMNTETGKDICDKIVESWPECQKYIKGVKGAIYKSFPTKGEAEAYLNQNNNLKKGINEYPLDIPHIYVDGSYNIANGDYGYGMVIANQNIIEFAGYGNGHEEKYNHRQVNGELHGAIEGIRYAISKGYGKVVMFYDYAGVCQHATGGWARNTELSKWYFEEVSRLKEGHDIDIIFVKIDSHTGDLFNDLADELAKLGAGVSSPSVADRAVASTKILVSEPHVKQVLSEIIVKNINNVIVDGMEDSREDIEKCALEEDNIKKTEDIKRSDEENIEEIIEGLLTCNEAQLEKKLKGLKTKTKSSVIKELINKLR